MPHHAALFVFVLHFNIRTKNKVTLDVWRRFLSQEKAFMPLIQLVHALIIHVTIICSSSAKLLTKTSNLLFSKNEGKIWEQWVPEKCTWLDMDESTDVRLSKEREKKSQLEYLFHGLLIAKIITCKVFAVCCFCVFELPKKYKKLRRLEKKVCGGAHGFKLEECSRWNKKGVITGQVVLMVGMGKCRQVMERIEWKKLKKLPFLTVQWLRLSFSWVDDKFCVKNSTKNKQFFCWVSNFLLFLKLFC